MADKMLRGFRFLNQLFEVFGVSGKAAVGFATFVFFGLSIYLTIQSVKLGRAVNFPEGVLGGYIAALGAYAANRTAKDWKGQNDNTPEGAAALANKGDEKNA